MVNNKNKEEFLCSNCGETVEGVALSAEYCPNCGKIGTLRRKLRKNFVLKPPIVPKVPWFVV